MVTSYTNDAGGPAPMEINYVAKGKSNGKNTRGKGAPKGKGKEKGKSKDAKGKGKSQSNGKGYADASSKGTGKGQTKSADAANRCNYCGNYGHWKRDCESSAEIILDSGADTSALPLAYGDVGESCSHEVGVQDFLDAQGGKLDIRDTRLATVDLGNGVILRERFIIANISCPLLALGHIVRAGWQLQHLHDGVYLVKKDKNKNIQVNSRRNSPCVHGCIRMISEDACFSPKTEKKFTEKPSIRTIHLEPVLRRLLPGWNQVNPQLFALRTRRARFVDTTICPATEMMFTDGAQVPSFDNGLEEEPDELQEPQPVEEVPADVPEAEPMDEDRVIPNEDESSEPAVHQNGNEWPYSRHVHFLILNRLSHPVHLAASRGYIAVVDVLLRFGAAKLLEAARSLPLAAIIHTEEVRHR
eukprot:s4093_g9.t1